MPAISNELKFFADLAFDIAFYKHKKETTLSDILYQRKEGWDATMDIEEADYIYMFEILRNFKKEHPDIYDMYGVWGIAVRANLGEFIQRVLYPYLSSAQVDAALQRLKQTIESNKE